MTTKYYISFDGSTYTQIYLSNEPIIKVEQEAGEIFFRKKIDKLRIGSLLNSAVYTSLESYWFDSAQFATEINYKVNINGTDRYLFYDTIRAGNIDTQNKIYECTPEPDDDYKPIMRLYNKKYDNISLLFGLAGNLYYPALVTSNFTNSSDYPFNNFTDYNTAISYENDGVPTGINIARNSIAVPANNALLTVLITNLSYTGDAPRMKLVDSGYNTCSNEVTINANGKYELVMSGVETGVYMSLSANNLTGASRSGSFNYVVYQSTLIYNGSTLYNMIDRVLNNLSYFDLNYDIVSSILWNDAVETDSPASIAAYLTANPTNDYVIEAAALWNNIWIARVDSFTTSKEDNLELCFKDLMDILKIKRFWWFIDSDGKFRIEHDKYFRSYTAQVNLTISPYHKSEIDHKNYSYELNGYNQINLIESNAVNDDWLSVKIEYDPKVTGDNVLDVRGNVTTDLKNIIDNAATISSGGLLLLHLDANNNVVFNESLKTTGTYYPNQKLSPLWFARYYMNYFAESDSGTVNSVALTIVHVKESIKQSGVKFYSALDLNWKKPFTMLIGTAWLISMEYNCETGYYSISVKYDPYQVNKPAVSPGGGTGSLTADSTLITADSTLITADGT